MKPLIACLLLGLAMAVSGLENRPKDRPARAAETQELAPPSELALMMRAMAAHADSVKSHIAEPDGLPVSPETFKGILEAEPTKGMHIDPITFPTFSADYLAKLDQLYEVPVEERAMAYNALIQSCANCHGSHCPGPLMRIKKMYVPR